MSDHHTLCPQSEIRRALRDAASNPTETPCQCDLIADVSEWIAQAIEADCDHDDWTAGLCWHPRGARIARNGGNDD